MGGFDRIPERGKAGSCMPLSTPQAHCRIQHANAHLIGSKAVRWHLNPPRRNHGRRS
jgi:hypothetical protein